MHFNIGIKKREHQRLSVMQAEAIKESFQVNSEITKNQNKTTRENSIFKLSSDGHKKTKKVLSIM